MPPKNNRFLTLENPKFPIATLLFNISNMGFYEVVTKAMSGYELYSQENVKDKKIVILLHWIASFECEDVEMSWYVTEFDLVSWDMFCYVENHTDPFCSEWWYSNLPHLLKCKAIRSYLDLSKKDSRASKLLDGLNL